MKLEPKKNVSQLIWSPIYSILEEQIKGGDELILVIVPFVKVEALKQLHWVQTSRTKIKIVCRWDPGDLTSGASDVEAFTYLQQNGCELYINSDIHLKLYIYASNAAFNTSGNLTLRGLGYSDRANIEVGNMVQLGPADWINIYKIIATSRQVDHSLYLKFKQYVDEHPEPLGASVPGILLDPPKTYTISALPATETPARLEQYYLENATEPFTPDEIRRAAHDLVTFGIRPGLSSIEFDTQLGEAFRSTPFVGEFVTFLQANHNLRFGAVNDWLHRMCEDVPLPYRWELKENTRIFYNWLAWYFSPDITWHVPGQRSQVICWQRRER